MTEQKRELVKKTEAYLQQHKQEIVENLTELVRIPSVGGAPVEGAPYGAACDAMLRATACLMEQNGFATVRRSDLGYTYSTLAHGGKHTLGLYAHGDVVPADGEWLVCPPFEPMIKDGFLFGRGGNDDKSGIVEMLWAAKLIRELDIPLQSDLLLFTGVNEETGMGDIKAFIEHEKVPQAGLVIDGACYPCDFGERSFYKFYITSKQPFTTLLELYGGSAASFNIILPTATAVLRFEPAAWEQVCALTAGKDCYQAEHHDERIILKAKGCAAPVTTPDAGQNAGALMVELLLQLDAVCDRDKAILQRAGELLNDGYGKGFGVEHTDSRFGRLTCGNGIIGTVEGHLKLAFDMRAGTELALSELIRLTKARVASDWEYEEVMASKGYHITEENRFRKALERYYKYVMGEDAPLGGYYFAGGTHARYLPNTVPVANQNKLLTPEYPMPKGHGGYHQPDEKVHIDSMIDAIKILVFLLMGMDEELNRKE